MPPTPCPAAFGDDVEEPLEGWAREMRWRGTIRDMAQRIAKRGQVANFSVDFIGLAMKGLARQIRHTVLAKHPGGAVKRKSRCVVFHRVLALRPCPGSLVSDRCQGDQGIGAAILMTLAMALMRETAGEDRRGRAMGLLRTMSRLAPVIFAMQRPQP